MSTEINKNQVDAKSTKNKSVKKKKKKSPFKKFLTIAGTTLLSVTLITIITGSIVATALTVYVMQFMDNTPQIDLRNLELSQSSYIYATMSDGTVKQVDKLSRDEIRTWIDITEIPDCVQMAFVAVEDERFYDHDGVDFKRTFSAFANLFLHFYDTKQGGSTITQQLVKNITLDTEQTWDRKIREIFTAMNLEDNYSKDEILEAYLNWIAFGGRYYGVEAASQRYFGKSVKDLSIAEAASLAAIPKAPNKYNPFIDFEANKTRKEHVLSQMLKIGAITTQEYEEALAQEIVLNKNTSTSEEEMAINSGVQSYFVDNLIEEVIAGLQEKYGLSREDATTKLYSGGLNIYSTVDVDMQKELEKKYLDSSNFSSTVLNNPPQSSFVVLNPDNGQIKAMIGGIGAKTVSRGQNRATMTYRSIGSCIKPLAAYTPALSLDLINWSTVFRDYPIIIKDENGKDKLWPNNYNGSYSNSEVFTFEALQESMNTVPAQLVEQLTPRYSFDFIKNNFNPARVYESKEINNKIHSDVAIAPMTVGSLTEGMSLVELVSYYQMFANGGMYYEPVSYTKVTDMEGNIILENKTKGKRIIDEDTAYIMNKLLETVVTGPKGTARKAKLSNTTLVGKTGTTNDWKDLWFVGCTPNYVSGVWYGYDVADKTNNYGNAKNTYYSSAQVWKNVFGAIADNAPAKNFPVSQNVLEMKYCTVTGLLANDGCPSATGYYKSSALPETCSGNH